MDIIWTFGLNCWQLLVMMSPYLLLGIVAAGLLHLFVPIAFIRKHLSAANSGAILKAALLGTPLPLCSCSVIPLAVSLKNAGASKGAVLSFLIATPITGVDSIIATYGVFGWLFTLYRLVAAVILAIVAGLLTLLLPVLKPAPAPMLPVLSVHNTQPTPKPVAKNMRTCLDYTLNVVLRDLSKPFIIGMILGGAMLTVMPTDWQVLLSEQVFWTYLLMLVIAPALYICATGSIPLAASLVLAGFSPGAAFILLSAGPATSTVTMSVVYHTLGKACFAIYLLTIVLGSLLFAVILDSVLVMWQIDVQSVVHLAEEPHWLAELSAVILGGLLAYYAVLLPLWQRYRVTTGNKVKSCCSSGQCE